MSRRGLDDARACVLAAIGAADAQGLARNGLAEFSSDLAAEGRVDVVAVGKAAVGMAAAAVDVLGRSRGASLALVPPGTRSIPPGFEVHVGGHPFPTPHGIAAARRISQIATSPDAAPAILFLISGGSSSLMALPAANVSLDDWIATTRALMAAGATIQDLNCVRKHIDELKGGRLGAACVARHVYGVILSDVVGDAPDVIASGPLTPDPTTYQDALAVIARLGVRVPDGVALVLRAGANGERPDTPKPGDPALARARTRVIPGNAIAIAAARSEAERRGYMTTILADPVVGEARVAGETLAARAIARNQGRPWCIVGGGETTVTVRGRGLGGRNQEIAAAAAIVIATHGDIAVASIGTDGIDGPTEAAGAVVDEGTVARARQTGFDLHRALAENDVNPALAASGDLIVTGPTGTNVMDVQVVLARP